MLLFQFKTHQLIVFCKSYWKFPMHSLPEMKRQKMYLFFSGKCLQQTLQENILNMTSGELKWVDMRQVSCSWNSACSKEPESFWNDRRTARWGRRRRRSERSSWCRWSRESAPSVETLSDISSTSLQLNLKTNTLKPGKDRKTDREKEIIISFGNLP